MAFAPDHILGRLEELNDALALERADPVEWVVCGGTALALHGLIRRTTRDVDVLGERQTPTLPTSTSLSPPHRRSRARFAGSRGSPISRAAFVRS